MDWFVRAFIKSSVAWLAAGVTLGVAMAVHPEWTVHRTAHMHMNLLGFVTMMIYGVAYHVLPRFSSHPLHAPALAGTHWWASNAGLALMVAGFTLRTMSGVPVSATSLVLASGGALSALGAYAFGYNVWRTLDGRSRREGAAAPAGSRPVTIARRG